MYNEYMKRISVPVMLLLLFLIIASPVRAFIIGSPDVTVSAYIQGDGTEPIITPIISPPPQGKFSIFGYTSPNAKVNIDNPGMYMDTEADGTGYFEFGTYFSRLMIEDICLVAQDEQGRVSPPVCIPPVPAGGTSSVGPIIMPPTISLNNDSFYTGDTITLTGQTTPNSSVKLSSFTDESKSSLSTLLRDRDMPTDTKIYLALLTLKRSLWPIHDTYAATMPKQEVKVDPTGVFTLTLPSGDPQYYRTFGQTLYQEAFSPKSITLNYDIFPGWFAIMKFAIGFLLGLKSRILELILMSQVILICTLMWRRFSHPLQVARMRALTLIEHPLPMMLPHELLLQQHEIMLRRLEEDKRSV